MTLEKLKSQVDFICSTLNSYEKPSDLNVIVPISEPSVGAIASVSILSVNRGFDWEAGSVILSPSSPLVRKGNSKENIISPHVSEYVYDVSGRKSIIRTCKMCGCHVKKDDKYCCNCGQRLR